MHLTGAEEMVPVAGPAAIAELAGRLWQAEVERVPIAPPTDERDDLVVEDGYATQSHNVERRVAAGRVVRGRKVGLTCRPTQQLLGVDEPDFGVLLDDMFVEDADEIARETLLQPRVEAEMAFVMARALGRLGSGLRRDDIVLPGALHRMTPARPGDVFRAELTTWARSLRGSGRRLRDERSADLADALIEAERSRTPIVPYTRRLPFSTPIPATRPRPCSSATGSRPASWSGPPLAVP